LDWYFTARVAQVELFSGVRFLWDVYVKWRRPSVRPSEAARIQRTFYINFDIENLTTGVLISS